MPAPSAVSIFLRIESARDFELTWLRRKQRRPEAQKDIQHEIAAAGYILERIGNQPRRLDCRMQGEGGVGGLDAGMGLSHQKHQRPVSGLEIAGLALDRKPAELHELAPALAKTIGIICVSRRAATAPGVPDVTMMSGCKPTLPRKRSSISIVFVLGSDPVAAELVRSLQRPGGNVTGVLTNSNVADKRRCCLTVVPGAARFAQLVNPRYPECRGYCRCASAAAAIGGQLEILRTNCSREIDTAFASLVRNARRRAAGQ
jgi:hypothetical protein